MTGPSSADRVHWVPQGIFGGAEVVTAEEYVAIAGPLDPEFDWPVPVATRGGVALYLRPRGPIDAEIAHLRAGGSVSVGPFTVTAAPGGGVTLTGTGGHAAIFATVEEFDETVRVARELVAPRKLAG